MVSRDTLDAMAGNTRTAHEVTAAHHDYHLSPAGGGLFDFFCQITGDIRVNTAIELSSQLFAW